MNNRNVGYWVATGLFALVYLASGVGDVLHAPPVLETLGRLGFPAYFASILGPWKIGAVVALVTPRLPRLKEWAYAGIVFDLTGGALSHILSGDPAWRPVIPLVLLSVAAASYVLRPASRQIQVPREPSLGLSAAGVAAAR